MSTLEEFCRQIRARSTEHRKAISLLYDNDLMAPLAAIIRQELDSIFRVIYLLTISNLEFHLDFIRSSVEGTPWKKK
jgi:hypothetical protein